MQYLDTCLLIAEADRGLCHVVMFLTAFFHRMYKMKHTDCQSNRKSDFGWHRFRFSPSLMRKRVEKSQAILALLDGFPELHLDR